MAKPARKKQPPEYRAVDLFSGCGGLTQGLKLAGFSVIGAIEIDSLAVATYAANHPEVAVKQADIGTIDPVSFMDELGVEAGDVDLLCGCPPCQGFSNIRTKNGSKRNRDARNGLSSEMLRFAQALRPKAVMMENVPGLIKHSSFKSLPDYPGISSVPPQRLAMSGSSVIGRPSCRATRCSSRRG